MTEGVRPATDDLPLGRWTHRWHAALEAAIAKGGIDSSAWGVGRVEVGGAAPPDELSAIEASTGLPIPAAMRALFLAARSVQAVWHLAEGVAPPEPLRDIFAGECTWSVDALPGEIESYRGWVAEVFPDPNDPYDAVWHGKYPWLHVPNGDLVALDDRGRVVYLSHDDGEGHGFVLGRDVFAFLDAWTRLGCPGPEEWQWLPFVAGGGEGLDPDGENGRAWRAWFVLP